MNRSLPPIIKSIKEGLVANKVKSIMGIMNGTANYILSQMTDHGTLFADVLQEAQEKGYAEADPSYDVDGIDTAHKLAILIYRMLKYGMEYVDRGQEAYEQQYQERLLQSLRKRAKKMGYEIVALESGEVVS